MYSIFITKNKIKIKQVFYKYNDLYLCVASTINK